MFQNFSTAEEVLGDAANSAGSALEENEKVLESIEGRTKRLQATFQDFAQSEAMVWGIKTALSAMEGALKNIVPILTLIIGMLVVGKWVSIAKVFTSIGANISSVSKSVFNLFKNLDLLPMALSLAKQHGLGTSAALKSVGVSASMAQVAIAGLTLVITGLVWWYQSYQRSQEKARQAAIDSAQATKDEIKSLEDYKSRISELRTALDSGTLSQEDANKKRQELLSIQDELLKKYKREAGGIDAVTEAINGQVDALDELAVKAAKDHLREGSEQIGKAKKFVTAQRVSHERTMATGRNFSYGEEFLPYFSQGGANVQKDPLEGGYLISIEGTQKEIIEKYKSIFEAIDDEVVASSTLTQEEIEKTLTAISNKINSLEDQKAFDGMNFIEAMNIYDEAIANQAIAEYSEYFSKVKSAQEEFNDAMNSGDQERIDIAKENIENLKSEIVAAVSKDAKFGSDMGDYFAGLFDFSKVKVAPPKIEIDIGTSLSKVADIAEDTGKHLKSLTDVLDDFKDKGKVTSSTLKNLNASMGNVKGYDEFLKVLANSSSTMEDVQDAVNTMTGRYLEHSAIIGALTDENKDLIVSQLELMGVTNAEEIATVALSQSKIQAKIDAIDFKNATADEISTLYDEIKALGATEAQLDYVAAQKILAANPNFANMTETERVALLAHANASETAGKWVNYLALQKQLVNINFLNTTSTEIEQLLGLAKAAGVAGNAIGQLARKESFKKAMEAGHMLTPSMLNELEKPIELEMPDIKFDIPEVNITSPDTKNDKTSSPYRSELDEQLIEKDRYYEINNKIIKSENELLKIKSEQDDLNENEVENAERLIQLYNDESKSLKEKQGLLHDLNEERRREREEISSNLSSYGISTSGEGDSMSLANYAEIEENMRNRVNSLRASKNKEAYTNAKDEYDKLVTLSKRFFEIQLTDLPKTSEEWFKLAKEINKTKDNTIKTNLAVYDDRLSQSKKYIEEKNFYDNWGTDNEIAAWERVKEYTEQFYKDGLISHEKYADSISEIDKNIYSNRKEQLQSAYDASLKVISEERDRIQSLRDAEEKYWNRRISNIRESNEEQERSIKLTELQERLANQRREKTKRVWREGQGWTYEVDQQAINETKKEIDAFNREEYIKGLEKERDKELKNWDKQLKDVEKVQKQWERISEFIEKRKQDTLLKSIFGDNYNLDIFNFEALKKYTDKYDSLMGTSPQAPVLPNGFQIIESPLKKMANLLSGNSNNINLLDNISKAPAVPSIQNNTVNNTPINIQKLIFETHDGFNADQFLNELEAVVSMVKV